MPRVFAAIHLNDSLMNDIMRDVCEMRRMGAGIKWVTPEQLHLTLRFIGNVPEETVMQLSKSLERAVCDYQTFEVVCGEFGCFPNMRSPRVLWIGSHEPTGELLRLQSAIERAVVECGLPAEERQFSPHLTIGRAKVQGRLHPELRAYLERHKEKEFGCQRVTSVELMRSDLHPQGARYTVLHSFALKL